MAIRKYKPTTPGRRASSVSEFDEITRSTPEKSLLRPLSKTGGRNNYGRITTRHIGGGHKRRYRLIDFRRNDKDGVPAKVAHIEYDPNRTARIALLHFVDAPVSGGISGAEAGSLTFMVGGADADVERARQFIEPMCGNFFATGGPTTGEAAKIVNNMMLAISLQGAAEGAVLARSRFDAVAAGIDQPVELDDGAPQKQVDTRAEGAVGVPELDLRARVVPQVDQPDPQDGLAG